jgi:hypothetical protein
MEGLKCKCNCNYLRKTKITTLKSFLPESQRDIERKEIVLQRIGKTEIK